MATAAAVAGSAAVLELVSPSVADNLSNILEILAPAVAALAAFRAARHALDRGWRRGWLLIAASCASWAVGQMIWTWFETIRNEPTPFPSAADVFFLLAIPLAVAGLLTMPPSSRDRRERTRVALDGMIVAASVLFVSWVLVLGPILHRSMGSRLDRAISLAYPAGDVMILTVAFVACSRTGRAGRTALGLTGIGFLSFALADGLFVYTTSLSDSVSNLSNVAWIAGYLLIALGAAHAAWFPPERSTATAARGPTSASMTLLPYIPVAVVLGLSMAEAIVSDPIVVGDAEYLIGTVLIILILLRQGVVLRDNARLTRSLEDTNVSLQYQVLHDSLTGLPNRPLFGDRLRVALTRMERLRTTLAVMFIDLDQFKQANDTHGHEAGDEILVTIAQRLVTAVRAGDTVARVGGDEFMVLCEDVTDADEARTLARRLDEAMARPVPIGGEELHVRGSIGLVVTDDHERRADDLVRQADRAMYQAKRGDQGPIVCVDATAASPADPPTPPDLVLDPTPPAAARAER